MPEIDMVCSVVASDTVVNVLASVWDTVTVVGLLSVVNGIDVVTSVVVEVVGGSDGGSDRCDTEQKNVIIEHTILQSLNFGPHQYWHRDGEPLNS